LDKQQDVQKKLADIQNRKADFDQEIEIIEGNAKAKALLIRAEADKQAKENLISKRKEAYTAIEDNTKEGNAGMIQQGKLGQFLLYTDLQGRSELNLLYNVHTTISDMRSNKFNSFT